MAKCRNFSPEFKAKDALAADAGRGILEHTRSDNGPEFLVQELRQWLGNLGTGTLFIEPGSPWENGYCESFNGKLRDECLNGEIFYSLKQTQIVIEGWRVQYNRVRRRARARRRAFSQPSRRDKSGRERPQNVPLGRVRPVIPGGRTCQKWTIRATYRH